MKAKDGAEEGQTADMVALAEGGDLRLGDGDGEGLGGHGSVGWPLIRDDGMIVPHHLNLIYFFTRPTYVGSRLQYGSPEFTFLGQRSVCWCVERIKDRK